VSERHHGTTSGGAPQLGEPLAIEFANTYYAVRGHHREGIGTPTHLMTWLHDNSGSLGLNVERSELAARVDAAEVTAFRVLRAAIRGIAQAVADEQPPHAHDVRTLNRISAGAPRWPELEVVDGECSISERARNDIVSGALARIARDAIRILGSPLRDDLRACHGPGCVLFFVKDHPRREWCSAACGNRARAARHYRRHHHQSLATADEDG